jgi:hypothetical protein
MRDEGRERMKYKAGDKTLLGEITYVDEGDMRLTYMIKTRDSHFKAWFTESEIDKIIIKPKRNIDRIIELWESGKRHDAEDLYANLVDKTGSLASDVLVLLDSYIEPSKYPKLTPDERKALELAKACGFAWIRHKGYTQLSSHGHGSYDWLNLDYIPALNILAERNRLFKLTEKPVSIDELLKDEV